MVDWDEDIRRIAVDYAIVGGGFEYDGKELAAFDQDAARRFFEGLKGKVQSVAISCVFSTVRNDHELAAAALCREVMGEDVHVSISSEIGSMGLIERENAAILNAALYQVADRFTEGFARSLAEEGVTVDQTVKALPAAESAAMPAEQLENAGYYGSTSAQYQVDIQADGTLTMSYLNYPTSIPAQTFTYCSDGSFRDSTGLSYISFVKERNGQTYLYQQAVSPLPGLGALPIANYAAVKLPENDLSPEVAAAWDSIATLGILPMNEPYNSQTFLALADAAAVAEVPETIPGYIGAARIADETTARSEIQVPGVGSRDGVDYQLEERDGVLWINAKGSLYMDAAAAPTLFTGSGASYTTIQADGYARWYQVGDAAGKTMTVQVPENSGFWVYDGNGQVTASSVLWGDTTVTLPEDGTIVFAGDPGARFHLRFQG